MRKNLLAAGLSAIVCFAALHAFAKTPATPKPGNGTIVIVFKDGHRQSFNLADIERVEFPTAATGTTAAGESLLPPRFLGRWRVGDGNGGIFYITLQEKGDAMRSLGDVHGHWVYVDGEARITWDDGAQDALRKAGSGYEKRAFGAGKLFTDTPDNVTNAQNLTPHPI